MLGDNQRGKGNFLTLSPFPPPSIRAYGLLKLLNATRRGEKSKQEVEAALRLGDRTWNLSHRKQRTYRLCLSLTLKITHQGRLFLRCFRLRHFWTLTWAVLSRHTFPDFARTSGQERSSRDLAANKKHRQKITTDSSTVVSAWIARGGRNARSLTEGSERGDGKEDGSEIIIKSWKCISTRWVSSVQNGELL